MVWVRQSGEAIGRTGTLRSWSQSRHLVFLSRVMVSHPSGGRYLPLRDDIASTAWWYGETAEGVPGTSLDANLMEVT